MKFSVIASIVGSLLLGVAALFVARFWLPAQKDDRPAAAALAPVDSTLQPMVVARASLAYGARLEADKLVIRRVPADAVPEGLNRQCTVKRLDAMPHSEQSVRLRRLELAFVDSTDRTIALRDGTVIFDGESSQARARGLVSTEATNTPGE